MIKSLVNNKKIKIVGFVIFVVIIIASVNGVAKFETAKEFDRCNRMMLIGSVVLCAMVSNFTNVKDMTAKLLVVGVTSFSVSLMAYNYYDKMDKYFSFEMTRFAWNGLVGLLGFIIYWALAYLMGMIIYFVKVKILVK